MENTIASSVDETLLKLLKALADENRLKIVGLVSHKPLSVEQLAEMLKLRPSTVSHHLSILSQAGLVSARAESYYNLYSLEKGKVEAIARQLLARETLPAVAASVDMDAYDRKVVADYSLPDGRLKIIPSQRKKLEAILRHVIQAFEPGMRYTERGVNEILARFHEDTAYLRRELVDYKMLGRESNGREYWRIEAPPAESDEPGRGKKKKDKKKKDK